MSRSAQVTVMKTMKVFMLIFEIYFMYLLITGAYPEGSLKLIVGITIGLSLFRMIKEMSQPMPYSEKAIKERYGNAKNALFYDDYYGSVNYYTTDQKFHGKVEVSLARGPIYGKDEDTTFECEYGRTLERSRSKLLKSKQKIILFFFISHIWYEKK